MAQPPITNPTPGPWVIVPGERSGVYTLAGGPKADSPEAMANARLMAAAPELLAALRRVVERGLSTRADEQAREALIKASGIAITQRL